MNSGAAVDLKAGLPQGLPAHERGGRIRRVRWLVAVLITIVMHGAIFFLARVPVGPQPNAQQPRARIDWVGDEALLAEGTLLGEQLAIFDSAPLFLPTSLNFATVRQRNKIVLQPGELFGVYPAKLTVEPGSAPPGLVTGPAAVETALAAVRGFDWRYTRAFGRSDPDRPPLPARVARIEVRSIESGEVRFVASLTPGEVPQATGWPDWEPFVLLVTVDAFGNVSAPVAADRGSGSDVVDTFIREHVARRLRLDLLVPPGYYRVQVGP